MFALLSVLLSGCAFISDDALLARFDLDGDGTYRPDDCDDADPELGAERQWFVDADGDGFGGDATVWRCVQDSTSSAVGGDCNDESAAIFPGAAEVCDGLDDDCDTVADDGVEVPTWYFDGDGDGYGTPFNTVQDCEEVPGYVGSDTDCNDADPALNPDTEWFPDADADGYGDSSAGVRACEGPDGYTRVAGDCDDSTPGVSPDAAELCDALDQDEDCDGLLDDSDPDATGQITWYADADEDGFGDSHDGVLACDGDAARVDNRRDCDDDDARVTTGCRWVQVSAGYSHTCGRREDGSVECWGYPSTSPSASETFLDVSAGGSASCGVHTDGSISCWGDAHYADTTPPTGTYTRVSFGFWTACALDGGGAITCWGHSSSGDPPPTTSGFTRLDLGMTTACALQSDGTIVGWWGATAPTGAFEDVNTIYRGCAGLDADGEIDDSQDTYSGVAPAGPFVAYDSDTDTSCAITASGEATCWGYDLYGEAEAPDGTFASISVGTYHVCAITDDGFMTCWGQADSGATTPPAE